jgi:uncharacterized iron-regulated membrane protein
MTMGQFVVRIVVLLVFLALLIVGVFPILGIWEEYKKLRRLGSKNAPLALEVFVASILTYFVVILALIFVAIG